MHSQNHRRSKSAFRNRSLSKANLDAIVRKANRLILAEALEQRVMLSGGPFTVSTLADSGTGSLRTAITSANSAGGFQTVTFASGLTGTIALASALPNITVNLAIDGPGASVITVSGQSDNGVFTINSGETVQLEGLTVTGGVVGGNGGGIDNNGGNVTLVDDVITGNIAAYGAGIFSNGTLTITGSTINNNVAATFGGGSGGGIYNQGVLTIVNSTISGNTAIYHGGGILSTTALSVTDSTVSGNYVQYVPENLGSSAPYSGGGIEAKKTTCTLNGTIVAGNAPYDLYGGTFTGSHDLVGNGVYAGTAGTITLTSSIVGSDNTGVVDAMLDPLANNGGPTPTQALEPGSPAIGQGAVFAAADGVDQRGLPRDPGFIDIGAFQTAEAPEPTLTVTNLNDSGTGSLRQAITTANLDYGKQTIVFAPALTGTISLASPLPSLIAATTIDGPGASVLTINGNSEGSVFTVSPGGTAQIENLTITGGSASSGGDIDNQGDLTVANSTITMGKAQYGGGIANAGLLTVTNCTISASSATIHGGGIFSSTGTLVVSNTTLSDDSSFAGGAIFTTATGLTVTASTLSGNTVTFNGGGIYVDDASAGYLILINSTLTGNKSGVKGGAVFGTGTASEELIEDSTISGNSAESGGGGGINGAATLYGDIVAADTGNDLSGTFKGNHDLIGDGSDSTSLTSSLTGTTTKPLNPDLGPLASNGGPTETEALLSGGPAIGAGATFAAADGVDQRGQPRPGLMGTDIGAYQTELIVNTLGDPSTVTAGTLSLRQAITDANSFGGSTIFFAPTLTGTINLASQLPAITGTLTIDGPGPSVITVNGGGHGSVFTISKTGQGAIENLTITDGGNTNINTDGGGILNDGSTLTVVNCDITGNTAGDGAGINSGGPNGSGTLVVTNSTISNNTSTRFGGGIYSTGPLTVTDSTISGNITPNSGGGIYTDNSTAHITSSTISGNSAYSGGGVESTFTQLTVTNSTFTGNVVTTYGGAIFTPFSVTDLTLVDSTVSGNKGKTGDGGGIIGYAALYGSIIAANTGGDLLGSFFGNHDLIGDGSDASSLTSSLSGTVAAPLNPLLSPLGNFGGPTLTMAPLPGSPAIGTGANFDNLATDQRGFARPTTSGIDIGADQGALFVGDTNFDGAVNLTDLLTLLNNYGETGKGWTQGDFNFDGTVNLTDLLALLNHYGQFANDASTVTPAAVMSYQTKSTPFASEPLALNSAGSLNPSGAGIGSDDADGEILQTESSVI